MKPGLIWKATLSLAVMLMPGVLLLAAPQEKDGRVGNEAAHSPAAGRSILGFTAASAGIDGGFYKADPHDLLPKVAPLIVLYSQNLKATENAIVDAGGSIVVPTFEFPGGRRFHFSDPSGNELAVWSE